MKRLFQRLPLLLVLAGVAAPAAPAATPTTLRRLPAHRQPAPDGQRFLFVVDISSAMRGADAANRQALFDMIFNGLEGQMRTGDTVGLWLFSDELRAGEFPMQVWDEQHPLDTASLAAKFLREQKYSGKARPDLLMPRLLNLVKSVRDVNVLIVSDGEARLEGTPFDANIAAAYDRRKSERGKAQKPFVTALTARGGAIVSGAVVIAGEYVKLPERPAPALARTGTNTVATPTNAARPAATASRAVAPPAAVVEAGEPQTTVSLNLQPVPSAPLLKPRVMQIVTRSNVAPPKPLTPVPAPPTSATNAPALPPAAPLEIPRVAATIFPAPLPVAAREPAAPPVAETRADPPAPVTVNAVAVPAAAAPAALLLGIGGVLLAACLGLLAIVIRRVRPRPQGSVITRSFERR